jgi:hypothetical protein
MSLFKFFIRIFWIVINLFQSLRYPRTISVIANLKDVSAYAKTYEEWLVCQEELDALSRRDIWSANPSVF